MHATIRLITTITLSFAVFSTSSCTTTGTQKRILTEPMTEDLEAKVLKETGISGAVVGAIVGGAAVGGLTFLALSASGASVEEALIAGAVAGVVGATAGGMGGYQAGKRQGQKVVLQAMDRDQVAMYLEGARQYNLQMAKNNEILSKELKSISQLTNQKERKSRSARASKTAKAELKAADKRVEQREKAIEGLAWEDNDVAVYKRELQELKVQRDQLRNTIVKLSETEVVTL
jgi:hypothetical protein